MPYLVVLDVVNFVFVVVDLHDFLAHYVKSPLVGDFPPIFELVNDVAQLGSLLFHSDVHDYPHD